MGVGLRTNVCNIGGDPLTQLLKLIKINAKSCPDSHESLYVRWVWGRGPIYIGGDPLSQFCIINFFLQICLFLKMCRKAADSQKMNGKIFWW